MKQHVTKSKYTWPYAKLIYGSIFALWVVYTALLFLTKTNDQYHMSLTATSLLRISFALPILAIWLVAAVAAVRFKAYATVISGSHEAPGFHRLASGLFFLMGYLVALILLGRIAPLVVGTSWLYPAVFVKNHMPVYLLLISLIELYRGAISLADVAKARPARHEMLMVGLGYIAFTTFFVAMFFSDDGNRPALSGGIPAFAVPHPVLLLTLVLPSLIAWFMGILASLYLRAYARKVKGRIYQKLLRQFLRGVNATTTFAILTELLVLNSSRLQHVGLNTVLIIVYLFLVAYGVGATLIVRSASKFTLMEVAS